MAIDPVTGSLITTGLNVAGGLFSQSSARGAYQHRYQDTVKDMRKAGLNPALAYGQNPGGGAQTHDFGDLGTNSLGPAASARQAHANAALTEAQTDVYKATAENLKIRTELENQNLRSQTTLADKTAGLRAWESNRARADADVAERTRDPRVSSAQTAATLERLKIPEARSLANFFTKTGSMNQYLNSAAMILRLLTR